MRESANQSIICTRKKMLTSSRYDMYKDVEESLARQRKVSYTDKYINGLPIGLTLSNGVTIGPQ